MLQALNIKEGNKNVVDMLQALDIKEGNKNVVDMLQALNIKEGNKNALVARSKCYLELGETEKALKDADEILADDPTNIMVS